MASIKVWARGFAQWIKLLFGGDSAERRPTIVADNYSANGALYRIHDNTIPGCVELWKIVHKRAGSDFVLVLLDVGLLKQELGIRSARDRARADPWQSQLSKQLANELKAQADVQCTHIIVSLWLRDRTRIDKKGRSYRTSAAVLVGAFACELQGAMGTLNGNRIAIAIVKASAAKLFRAQNATLLNWEKFVDQVPWLEWFEAYAKHYLGQDHVLQPVKRRKTQ